MTLDVNIPTAPRPTHDPGGASDFDRRLQLSRRLDWRFLLPTPRLGRVALLAGESPQEDPAGEMAEALVEFSDELDVVRFPFDSQYEVIVAVGLDVDRLPEVFTALRPAGSLVVQIRRDRWPWRRRSQPGRWLAAARRAGLAAAAYCHWPNFTECTRIIPLADRAAVVASLAQWGQRVAGSWGRLPASLAARCGLWRPLVTHFSVVARRPPE